jgi:hypothetical protein
MVKKWWSGRVEVMSDDWQLAILLFASVLVFGGPSFAPAKR